MTALVVTDKFAPHAGGTSVVWTEWCRRWPASQTRVVTREFPCYREFDRSQSYQISRVPYLDIPKVRQPYLWMRLAARTARECRRGAHMLHCAQTVEMSRFAPSLSRRYKVPYAAHTYGEELSTQARNPRSRARLSRMFDSAAVVTTISANSQRLLREEFGYRGPVLLVYPGVDTNRFTPGPQAAARNQMGIGEGPVILTVSRLMRRKGHDKVLAALTTIRDRFPKALYLIAGTGQEETRLRRLVDQLGLSECVRFLGRVSDADLVPLMRSADVFVHPNRELENGDVEGFGIVFLEANACGLPVIGGNSGGAPDAIRHGETGYLVDPNNVDEIADRVCELLEDAALRKRMGEAGREWAKRFSWDDAAAKVWELSQQVARAT